MALYSLENIQLDNDPDGISVQFDVHKDGVYSMTHSGMIRKFKTVNDIVAAIQKMALAVVQNDLYQSTIFPQAIAWFEGKEWEIG